MIEYLPYITLYSFIGWLYYDHNRKMGSLHTGIIMASFWFIVAFLWIWGFWLVWREDVDMNKRMEKYNGS